MNRKERRKIMHGMGKLQKKIKKALFGCLFPGCSQGAIRSHSQQKEGQLRTIAREGMVYVLDRNFYRSVKGTQAPLLELIPTGIAEASIFPGFCGNHDKDLFADLEDHPLTKGDRKQALLLFLRTIAYEYAQKRRGAMFLEGLLREASGLIAPEVAREMALVQKGMKIFVSTDGRFYLGAAFAALKEVSFDWFTTEWQVIPINVGASCSCCFSPLLDNHVDYMIKHIGEIGPVVTFNLIPRENHTHIIVSWHEKDSKHTPWIIESMGDKSLLELFINRCAIVESEDTCFNPDLWENTYPDVKIQALNAMRPDMFRGPIDKCPLVIRI
jgi:hypothetical protein